MKTFEIVNAGTEDVIIEIKKGAQWKGADKAAKGLHDILISHLTAETYEFLFKEMFMFTMEATGWDFDYYFDRYPKMKKILLKVKSNQMAKEL